MSDIPRSIRITEEGPREGFQIEPGPIPTQRKVDFINALGQCRPSLVDLPDLHLGFVSRLDRTATASMEFVQFLGSL